MVPSRPVFDYGPAIPGLEHIMPRRPYRLTLLCSCLLALAATALILFEFNFRRTVERSLDSMQTLADHWHTLYVAEIASRKSSDHQLGLALLERTKSLDHEKRILSAHLTAARAVGLVQADGQCLPSRLLT